MRLLTLITLTLLFSLFGLDFALAQEVVNPAEAPVGTDIGSFIESVKGGSVLAAIGFGILILVKLFRATGLSKLIPKKYDVYVSIGLGVLLSVGAMLSQGEFSFSLLIGSVTAAFAASGMFDAGSKAKKPAPAE